MTSEGGLAAFGRRRLAPAPLLAALLAAVLAGPLSAAPAGEPVRLEIANAKAAALLRCQLVLAHFVTLAPAPIGPAGRVAFELRRDPDGSLFYPHAEGPPMALENVLCGLDEDWTATRNDLDLRPLRGGEERLLIVCDGERGLACAPE